MGGLLEDLPRPTINQIIDPYEGRNGDDVFGHLRMYIPYASVNITCNPSNQRWYHSTYIHIGISGPGEQV